MKTVTMKAVPAAQSHFRNMNQSSPRPPTPTRKNSDHLSLSLLSVDASCSPSGHSSSSNNNNNHSSTSSPLIATSDLFFATSQTNNTNIKVTTNDQATRPVSPSFLSTPPSSSTSSTPSIFERCQTPMPSRISSLPQPPSSLSTARRSSLANESPVGGVGGGGHDGQGQAQGRSSPWKNGWRQDVISNHFESALAGGSVPMIPLAQHSHELSDQQIFQASRSGAADDEATSGELAQPHQGVIMAYAGPGASFSLGTGMASNNDEGASSSTGPRVSDWSWVRLTHFMRPLVSQSLVSRLYSRRPQFSNMGSSSWSIVRYGNINSHLFSLSFQRNIRRERKGIATRSKKGIALSTYTAY
ncbi:MAG: hypothetical protein BYD32DRAFT_140210 [Podila humilis]|nr:MAG: hypothetical protein BYD32DRAFT_140210 [Podila humilis]